MKKGIWVVLACALWSTGAQAQELEQEKEYKCLSRRAAAAGNYQLCLQKWQRRLYGGHSATDSMLAKCRVKYAAVWPKLQKLTGTSCDVARFKDNLDGTVTDNLTGLVWEKKDDSGGIHDKDNWYDWSSAAPYTEETGTAFTVHLMTLNGTSFAGSNGWRLPTWAELQTILLPEPSFPCSTDPCIDPVFDEPVGVDDYWTATTIAGHPEFAWYVQFGTGGTSTRVAILRTMS